MKFVFQVVSAFVLILSCSKVQAQTFMERFTSSDATNICSVESGNVNSKKFSSELLLRKSALSTSDISILISNGANASTDMDFNADELMSSVLRGDKSGVHEAGVSEKGRKELESLRENLGEYFVNPTAPTNTIFVVAISDEAKQKATSLRNGQSRLNGFILLDLFLLNDGVILKCTSIKANKPNINGVNNKSAEENKRRKLGSTRLRGTIEGLSVSRPTSARNRTAVSRFNSQAPARLSVTNNGITDTTTVAIRFSAGTDIAPFLFPKAVKENVFSLRA